MSDIGFRERQDPQSWIEDYPKIGLLLDDYQGLDSIEHGEEGTDEY